MELRQRGVNLPPWTDKLGLATNRLWAEVIRRERQLEATQINHEIMKTYAMNAPAHVEWKDRYAMVEPLFKKLLAELDQSAYRTDHLRGTITEKIRRLEEEKKLQDYMNWMSSDDFSVTDWVKGGNGE